MLPIFFLAFTFIYQLSTTSGSIGLDYYDANRELSIINKWYKMVKIPLNKKTSKKQLETEALKRGSRMYEYLQRAVRFKKTCVRGLTPEECLVVTMYTDDGLYDCFNKEYSVASKSQIWEPYRVYTTLLISALRKLAKIDPTPSNATLYRGISFRPEKPKARRIFWKAFTSTSLDIEIAKEFAGPNGTILEFRPPASRYAAQVGNLSVYPREREVILLPFEAFDILGSWWSKAFAFKTAKTQELLHPPFWRHDELRALKSAN